MEKKKLSIPEQIQELLLKLLAKNLLIIFLNITTIILN